MAPLALSGSTTISSFRQPRSILDHGTGTTTPRITALALWLVPCLVNHLFALPHAPAHADVPRGTRATAPRHRQRRAPPAKSIRRIAAPAARRARRTTRRASCTVQTRLFDAALKVPLPRGRYRSHNETQQPHQLQIRCAALCPDRNGCRLCGRPAGALTSEEPGSAAADRVSGGAAVLVVIYDLCKWRRHQKQLGPGLSLCAARAPARPPRSPGTPSYRNHAPEI